MEGWAMGPPEVVEFSLVLSGGSVGRIELMILVGILHNMTEQLNETTSMVFADHVNPRLVKWHQGIALIWL